MKHALAGAAGFCFVVLLTAPAHAEPAPDAAQFAPPPVTPPLAAERDRFGWAVPDYARLQVGGFLGLLTVVVGYSAFRDILNVQVAYGFVPEMHDVPPTHIVSAFTLVRPLRFSFGDRRRFQVYPLYVGAGALCVFGPNVFVKQPPEYPKGYYPPTAFHLSALFGAEIGMRAEAGNVVARQSVFVEFVTIDQYLDALKQNKELFLTDAFSTAFGYRASF